MVYACDHCHFLFKRVSKPEQCPDCGKYAVRPATDAETKEFFERLSTKPQEEQERKERDGSFNS